MHHGGDADPRFVPHRVFPMFHALAGGRLLPRLPKPLLRLLLGLPRVPISREQRLAMFPQADLPLERSAVIRWNEHLVPYIEAETDRDLAFCLGLVHAHLREAQMEFLKVLAFGRVAEILGPLALEVDKALRIVDFGHAVPEIERRLPAETRVWLEAYCLGLNTYWARVAAARAGVQAPVAWPSALERA